MAGKTKDEYLLSSVKNALRILRCFTVDEPEKKTSEIAQALGLHKSTVSRTLATLASEDFVIKDPETKKYRLGLSVLSLSGVVSSNLEIVRESMPILRKLVDEIGETAHIAVLDGYDTIYLQKVECNHPVRFQTHVGRRNPAYCTSSGKVLLAFSDEKLVDEVIKDGLQSVTKNTITNEAELRKQLQKIKDEGFAYSNEEFTEGVISIAAPIYDYTNKVIAALTVVGPKQRISPNKIRPYAKKIIKASMEISDRMGYWR